jgi:hypothetical protein
MPQPEAHVFNRITYVQLRPDQWLRLLLLLLPPPSLQLLSRTIQGL